MRGMLTTTTGKVLASAALVAGAAGVAGMGTYGAFTASTSASERVAAGTVNIALGADGTAANRLSVAATGVVPGDTIQRALTLTNPTGNQNWAGVTLTTAPAVVDGVTKTSLLNTDAVNGLQVKIESCSGGWTESTTTPYTYTCATTPVVVLAQKAIIGTDVALSNLSALTAGNTDNLRVTTTLPSTANNDFQGLTSTINFAFTATQRAATAK